MPSTRPTTPTKLKETPTSDALTSPDALSAHSAEALSDLKSLRAHEHGRKMALKGGEWKRKQHARMPWEYYAYWGHGNRRRDIHTYTNRPHMVPAVKGGWHVKLDETEGETVWHGETDWVVEGSGAERPREEVTLAELAKPGKRRKHRKRSGDFEVVLGSQSVIVLDDYELPEPSINEPWECLDLDDEDRETSQKPSYAEVVAHPSS